MLDRGDTSRREWGRVLNWPSHWPAPMAPREDRSRDISGIGSPVNASSDVGSNDSASLAIWAGVEFGGRLVPKMAAIAYIKLLYSSSPAKARDIHAKRLRTRVSVNVESM